MTNTEMINGLAMNASKDGGAFNELFLAVEPQFQKIVDSYLIKNNLTGFNFDQADYISATGQAMWECVAGYDSAKGNFMPRVAIFAFKRMKEVTDYNLAGKRFNKAQSAVSYDQLFGMEEFAINFKFDNEDYLSASNPDIEVTDESNETEQLINEFIKHDKDGEVIEILLSTNDTKLRNSRFVKLFGQYGATERKKVQRARERLQTHLTSNGVLI
ncbi:hypothetical protein JCM17380_24370 [Desulfosporosinus burensis]